MGATGSLFEVDATFVKNGRDVVGFRDTFENKNYQLLGEFTSRSLCSAWLFFGGVLNSHYKKAYQYYEKLTERLSDEHHSSGYLLPSEVKAFFDALEKIRIDEFLIRCKEELKKRKSKDSRVLDTLERGFVVTSSLGRPVNVDENSLTLLKKILKKVMKDEMVLCLHISW